MKTAKTTKLWLKVPRIAWQNLGGPVPYRLRRYVKRRSRKLVTIRSETVGKRQWLVIAGDEPFVFPTATINQFYGRTPPGSGAKP